MNGHFWEVKRIKWLNNISLNLDHDYLYTLIIDGLFLSWGYFEAYDRAATIRQTESGTWRRRGGKNGSATAKAIIYLPMNMKLKQV